MTCFLFRLFCLYRGRFPPRQYLFSTWLYMNDRSYCLNIAKNLQYIELRKSKILLHKEKCPTSREMTLKPPSLTLERIWKMYLRIRAVVQTRRRGHVAVTDDGCSFVLHLQILCTTKTEKADLWSNFEDPITLNPLRRKQNCERYKQLQTLVQINTNFKICIFEKAGVNLKFCAWKTLYSFATIDLLSGQQYKHASKPE